MRKFWTLFITLLLLTLFSTQVALAQQGGHQIHYVTWGDSLSSIATRYGVTTDAIMRQNGLSNPDFVYIGQALVIPTSGYNMGSGYHQQGCNNTYVVRAGDTLSSIAWQHGTSVQQLLQANNLYNKDFVYVGQKLCVPGSSGMPAYEPDYSQGMNYQPHHNPMPMNNHYHRVMPGETLTGIAYKYGVNIWSIVEANNLNNASYIWVGQKLIIPGQQSMGYDNYGYDRPAKNKDNYGYDHYKKKDNKKDKDKDADKPDVYIRLGRNVNYQYWGRPQLGLADCNDWTNNDTVKRLTVEVILTNNSNKPLPNDWASPSNVIIYMASGSHQQACKHIYGYGSAASNPPTGVSIHADPDSYPGTLYPGETTNVTYYTHMEKNDYAIKIGFKTLDICFDVNSGDRIACNE